MSTDALVELEGDGQQQLRALWLLDEHGSLVSSLCLSHSICLSNRLNEALMGVKGLIPFLRKAHPRIFKEVPIAAYGT